MDNKIREALKKDFNNLYVKKFCIDYEAKRLIRGMEIDIMDLSNLKKLFKEEV